jgi:beta-mannosidase
MEFRDSTDELRASGLYYFAKPKELELRRPNIVYELKRNDENTYIELRSDTLVRNLYLNLPDREVFFSNNYFDLLPGQIYTIEISGEIPENLEELMLKHL